MVLDTSALICLLQDEAEAPRMAAALEQAEALALAAPTWLETAIVITARRGEAGFALFGELVRLLELEIVPFDASLAATAHAAWQRFGKGRHPAGLNMGDCQSYALARQRSEPLLFKGEDFSQTDIGIALY